MWSTGPGFLAVGMYYLEGHGMFGGGKCGSLVRRGGDRIVSEDAEGEVVGWCSCSGRQLSGEDRLSDEFVECE